MRGPRILVSGYYGFGNAGDEAILWALARALRESLPAAELRVLSAAPDQTREWQGLAAVPRFSLPAIVKALRWTDLLLSGGGTLLQDLTSPRSIPYYAGLILLARACGRPVLLYGQGVGPIRGGLGRWLARLAADSSAEVVVRDPASAALLRQLGVQRPPLAVAADPVLGLTPAEAAEGWKVLVRLFPEEAERLAALRREGRPWVGLALRLPAGRAAGGPGRSRAAARAPGEGLARLARFWAAVVQGIRRELGGEVLLLGLHPQRDRELLEAVREEVRKAAPEPPLVAVPLAPAEWLGVVGELDLVAGMRLHALIFAAVMGVPFLGVVEGAGGIDPKMPSFLAEFGMEPVRADAPDRVVEALREAWAGRAALQERVAAAVPRLRRRAREGIQRLASRIQEVAGAGRPSGGRLQGTEELSGRVKILDLPVDCVSLPEAVERIAGWVAVGRSGYVVTANPELAVRARREPSLQRIVAGADLVTADGVGILWAARLKGKALPERVSGIDLAEELLARGAQEGWRFFFLGGEPGVAEAAAEAARRRGVQVVGWRHGFFPPAEEEAVAAEVGSRRPQVALVGLGSPRQESWCARYASEVGAVLLGVGGALDVLAGRKRRAPVWMRRCGLEWLYRLAKEPRRWRRVLALPVFVWWVLRER
ncbi:MAG: WecB/TagA/CpsF family glycosyltransferase, partial [Bacillota bacterium]|nr:WecB/TagA/CpsF family glycosyltransferase [Bacillota bacterium]